MSALPAKFPCDVDLENLQGSILTRFVLEDSSFCFINSHLTSGQKKPMERTRDIIEIMENARFPRPSSSSTRLAYVFRGDGTQVSDQELVFYCGELSESYLATYPFNVLIYRTSAITR